MGMRRAKFPEHSALSGKCTMQAAARRRKSPAGAAKLLTLHTPGVRACLIFTAWCHALGHVTGEPGSIRHVRVLGLLVETMKISEIRFLSTGVWATVLFWPAHAGPEKWSTQSRPCSGPYRFVIVPCSFQGPLPFSEEALPRPRAAPEHSHLLDASRRVPPF